MRRLANPLCIYRANRIGVPDEQLALGQCVQESVAPIAKRDEVRGIVVLLAVEKSLAKSVNVVDVQSRRITAFDAPMLVSLQNRRSVAAEPIVLHHFVSVDSDPFRMRAIPRRAALNRLFVRTRRASRVAFATNRRNASTAIRTRIEHTQLSHATFPSPFSGIFFSPRVNQRILALSWHTTNLMSESGNTTPLTEVI